jgi:hypothetical protein
VPPRYAFWTILIDQKPTAFRAREQEELRTTLAQLRRTNKDVVLKWFSRGRLWESPEQEREAQRAPKPVLERRTREWRPGGTHKDPRARFQKRKGSRPTGSAERKFGADRDRPFGSAQGKPPRRGPKR